MLLMGIIDVIVLVIIGIVAFKGFIKGIVMEIFGMIALIAGFLVAYIYSPVFAKQLGVFGMSERTTQALGYITAFFVAYLVTIFIGLQLSRLFKEVKLNWVNQGVGALFGGLKAAAILSVFLSFLMTTLSADSSILSSMKEGSVSRKLADFAPNVYDVMNKIPEVKKHNPFEIPSAEDVQQAIEDAKIKAAEEVGETVKETAKTDDAGKKGENAKPEPKKGAKVLEEEFQKN
jgi:membrane protein required for colicin V production